MCEKILEFIKMIFGVSEGSEINKKTYKIKNKGENNNIIIGDNNSLNTERKEKETHEN